MVRTHARGVAVLRAGCDCSIVEAMALWGVRWRVPETVSIRPVEQERPKLCFPERHQADSIPLVRTGADRC